MKASSDVYLFFTAEDAKVRRGLGVGRLARLWRFSAISAPSREILNHACGMMSLPFFVTLKVKDPKIPSVNPTASPHRHRAPGAFLSGAALSSTRQLLYPHLLWRRSRPSSAFLSVPRRLITLRLITFSPQRFGGGGRLARLWRFSAISAPSREILNHACGMTSLPFFITLSWL